MATAVQSHARFNRWRSNNKSEFCLIGYKKEKMFNIFLASHFVFSEIKKEHKKGYLDAFVDFASK